MKKNKSITSRGFTRFTFYVDQLETKLIKASKQKNPALWLYRNDARTTLFMLEGLAKMYTEFHNKKFFAKLKEKVKILEDTIGVIDYYDAFAKEFKQNKNIPAAVTTYLEAQAREKTQSLNEILKEDKWLGETNERIEKLRSKLLKADWEKEKEDTKAIDNFYGKSIYEIVEFVNNQDFRFENVELGIHELRRKLRWLSIYPQALQGNIQLSRSKNSPDLFKKYLTKEIVNSPFNKLPEAGDSTYFLMMNQNNFLALSWMIAALGKLKDSGLRVIAIKEALQQTSSISDAEAFKTAYQYTGKGQEPIKNILENATAICKTFFTEHILENLVIGVRKIEA
jgi:hypothetical protein